MAPEAGTSSGPPPRRKTLDDIRREIDAEYAPAPDASDAPDVATPSVRGAVAHRREHSSPWRGYVLAGAIGCIAGQLMILAYVAVARYGGDLVVRRAANITPRLSAPILRADDVPPLATSIRPDAAPTSATGATSSAPSQDVPSEARGPSLPDRVASTDASDAAPSAAPHAGGVEARAVAAPAAVQHTMAPARVPDRRAEVPAPPAVRQSPRSPTVTPPSLQRPLVGPGDWVESQAQLRSALSEWLALSERGGETEASDAEVILGADGRTAKTRVSMRSRTRAFVREQRWERGANGWNIVEDREVGRAQP